MSQPIANLREILLIREQLQSPDPAIDLPYDSKWALSFIEGEMNPPPEILRNEVVIALIELLVDRGEAHLLTRLAEYSHREVAKAARKGLHRLRTKKVDIQIPQPVAPPPSGTGQVAKKEIKGLISMYDQRMHRSVWLPHDAPRGLVLNRARISAESGLVDFEVWASSRKKYRQMARMARQHIVVEEVEPEIVRWLIHDAARQAQGLSRGLPEEYTKSSQILGSAPEMKHPAEEITPAEPTPSELAKILRLKALSLWIPEQEFMRRVSLKIQEISTSRIIVDDRQRRVQIDSLLEKSVGDYFTPQRMQACRRVLLDTAHLLYAGGNLKDAALVRAGAEFFLDPGDQIRTHDLPRRFLERVLGGLNAPVQEEALEEQPGGNLILPG